ncbi:MAG: YlmH family RNA-binding protein, partial [Saccharofermentanales bacterium]
MAESHFYRHLSDLADQADEQGYVTHSAFLSPAEKEDAAIWLKKNRIAHLFSGGFADAERQIAFFLPDYMADSEMAGTDLADDILPETITALRLDTPVRATPPSHRDYLGSLLSLGIKRSQLGDILVSECTAVVLVLANIAVFIKSNLEHIGGLPVTVTAIPLSAISAPVRSFELIRITVASMRLDKITSAGFGLPRTEIAERIRSGAVQLNWREETRPDKDVPVGAVITLRGYGRILLAREEGLSRKNRHILELERY